MISSITYTKQETCPKQRPGTLESIVVPGYDMCFTTDMMEVSQDTPFAHFLYEIPKLKKVNEIHVWLLDQYDKEISYPPLHAHHLHLGGHHFETHGDYFDNKTNSYRFLRLQDNNCIYPPQEELYGTVNLVGDKVQFQKFRAQYCVRYKDCKYPLTKIDINYVRMNTDCWQRYNVPTGKSYIYSDDYLNFNGDVIQTPYLHAHRDTFKAIFMFENTFTPKHLPRCTSSTNYFPYEEVKSCLCQSSSCFDFEVLRKMPGLICHYIEDSRSTLSCNYDLLQSKKKITMITFNDNKENQSKLQHTHFFMYQRTSQSIPFVNSFMGYRLRNMWSSVATALASKHAHSDQDHAYLNNSTQKSENH